VRCLPLLRPGLPALPTASVSCCAAARWSPTTRVLHWFPHALGALLAWRPSPSLLLRPCSDIKRLWQVAGQRYRAPKQQVAAAIGPEYSLWKVGRGLERNGVRCSTGLERLGTTRPHKDCKSYTHPPSPVPTHTQKKCINHTPAQARMHPHPPPAPPPPQDLPASPAQLSHFRGKAALPTHVLGVSRFSKAFFLQPGSEVLYGRVLLGKGPLGDLLYPLYFQASVGTAVVPSELLGLGARSCTRSCACSRLQRLCCVLAGE
jgi:hypothetical protein